MTGAQLAAIDTTFGAVALVCMLAGWRAILRKRRAAHRRLMLAAFASSCAFLVVFITRIASVGLETARAEGARRVVAISIMVVHDGMAVAVIPLVIVALVLGLRGDVARHREVARIALPMWVWVSFTGILAWLVLWAW